MKYDRQLIQMMSLQEGDVFQHPLRDDTLCKVSYANLKQEEHQQLKIIGYTIVEGQLHWPVLYAPADAEVTLLLPTTTFVQLSGKDWISSLTEEHGTSA